MWVIRVSEEFREGRLEITSDTADYWRVLSGPDPNASEYEVTEVDEPSVNAPVLVRQTIPRYTAQAENARIEGNSLLSLVISDDGSVDPQSVYILRTTGYGLEENAIEAIINDWIFEPGSRDGEPRPMLVMVEISFYLRR